MVPAGIGETDGFRLVYRHRFLDEDVFSLIKRADTDFRVAEMRRRDDDGVDIGTCQKFVRSGERGHIGSEGRTALFTFVADGGECGAVDFTVANHPGVVGTHVPDADDAEPDQGSIRQRSILPANHQAGLEPEAIELDVLDLAARCLRIVQGQE